MNAIYLLLQYNTIQIIFVARIYKTSPAAAVVVVVVVVVVVIQLL